jgi:hypothetical protein
MFVAKGTEELRQIFPLALFVGFRHPIIMHWLSLANFPGLDIVIVVSSSHPAVPTGGNNVLIFSCNLSSYVTFHHYTISSDLLKKQVSIHAANYS